VIGASKVNRRRGVALVITLMVVVLLVSVTARLASTAAVEAVRASRRVNTLQHELAVDSLIRAVAGELSAEGALAKEFERRGHTQLTCELGDCRAACRIANDAAKFNVAAFAADRDRRLLQRKLTALGRRMSLPPVKVNPRPVHAKRSREVGKARYLWYDQLFRGPSPEAFFRRRGTEAVEAVEVGDAESLAWSDVVTLFGDGQVDIGHAEPEVLRVLLEDVDRSAALALAAARRRGADGTRRGQVLSKLPTSVRRKIKSRVGTGLRRYALTIETAIRSDRRRWYVVADMAKGEVSQVYYRGRIEW